MNIHYDWASSVMVPLGCQIDLYDWDGLEGSMISKYGLVDSDGYMVCQNLHGFEDRLASAKVTKYATARPEAKWRMVGNGDTTYHFTAGWSSTNKDSETSVQQESFS